MSDAARAVDLIRQVRDRHHFRAASLLDVFDKEPYFDPLRPRDDFRAALVRLRADDAASRRQWAEAAARYTELLADLPDDRDALLARGEARFQLGQHEKAVADFDRALALGAVPGEEIWWHVPVAYRFTAQAHHARKDPRLRDEYYAKAIAYAEAQIRDQPHSPWRWNEAAMEYSDRAELLHSAGEADRADVDVRQAVTCLLKALDLGPAGAGATGAGRKGPKDPNYRSWLLRELPRLTALPATGAAYREVARRAAETDRDDAEGWHVLGVAHYRAGDWAPATEAPRRAVELRAADSAAKAADRLYLAAALCHTDDRPAARQCFDEAAAWVDKHPPADDGLRKIRAEAAALLGAAGDATGKE